MSKWSEARKEKQNYYLNDPKFQGEFRNNIPIEYYLYLILCVICFVMIWNKIEKLVNRD